MPFWLENEGVCLRSGLRRPAGSRDNLHMSYTLTLTTFEEASDAERQAAEQRFRGALDAALGDASLVAPTYAAFLHIIANHGDSPDVTALTDSEREIVEQWQAAEAAAMTAAFGPHRYLEEPRFEIGLP
jgi:hypothetical protein